MTRQNADPSELGLRQVDVAVVGAGPAGLLLAAELRLGGADVAVLEQRTEPMTESRASTLHARTMEHLDSRGLLDRFGALPRDLRGHLGGLPLDLSLDSRFAGQWKAPQTLTEQVLGDWAAELGAEVRRGYRVHGLSDACAADGVTLDVLAGGRELQIRAGYVVGCDGADSSVRALAGIALSGSEATRQLIRADVTGLDVRDRRFERLPLGMATAARRADGVTRVMAHEFGRRPDDAEVSFERLCALWQRLTGEDISRGTPIWLDVFDDASLLADTYRRGRVLLAGDAAHQQLPAGGQALNLGLLDAANLGWKLAAVSTGRAPEDLLDSYHSERHSAGSRVLTNIQAQTTLLLGGAETNALRTVVGELLGFPDAAARLAGTISGITVRAGLDDRVLDEDGRLAAAQLQVGHRWTTLAELLRPGRGILLGLGLDADAAARLQAQAAPWSETVDVVTATAAPSAGAQSAGNAYLVRPDGELAWSTAGDHDDAAGLAASLCRWFGTAAASARPEHAATPPRPHPHTEGIPDMTDLTGKTALVTGASRGIGSAIARRLAREGALVAVHYSTNSEAAAGVVAAIESDGGRAFALQSELGVPGDVHELFFALEHGLKERTGSVDLDILVNNAGVTGETAVEDVTPEQFDRLVAVNAKAPFFIIQRALTNLAPGGRIVNISSGLTRVANPGEIAYAMTKGAVEQLALHFAKVLAPRGVTINSVAPGITRNGNPLFDNPDAVRAMAGLSAFDRVGEPEDVADIVAFLVSEKARWMTGAFVDASGGTLLGG